MTALGVCEISASFVSRIAKELDVKVEEFSQRVLNMKSLTCLLRYLFQGKK
jgi:transposase-like protein